MRQRLFAIALATTLFGCGAAVSQSNDGTLRVELRGNRIVINDRVQFEHDSDVILEQSHPILDRVVEILGEHDEIIRVQVQGHTSTDGSAERNQVLSEERAAAVAAYLRDHGVTQEVTSQGYGPTYPLCREETEECHEQNRRVEFFVDVR